MHNFYYWLKIIKKRSLSWIEFDSFVDSTFYGLYEWLSNAWSAYSDFMGGFRVFGIKAFVAQILSDMITLGTVCAIILLALAIPAFDEISEHWMDVGQYSVTFEDRHGNEIGKRGILHYDDLSIKEIPKHVINAVLATEDRRFYKHHGIDFFGTFRALIENAKAKGVVQGGSSITQQLAKNVFLTPERSLKRKIKEAFLSIWLEHNLTKDEILKLYLDRSYMGGGAFGIEAASWFYFDKSVRQINLAEAAMLAGLFKAPTRYAPHINPKNSIKRARLVLTNMVEAGFMQEHEVADAKKNPAKAIVHPNTFVPNYFLDWAFEEVQRLAKGKREYVLVAKTTVDIRLQQAADFAIKSTLRRNRRRYRVYQGAMVVMEHDGAVRAIVGGRSYGRSQFNRATKSKRQPGSSFKPYVYLTAIERGYRPRSAVYDSPVRCGRWTPKNYAGRYRGRMSLTTALKKSINTVAVKLSLRVGRQKVLDTVRKLRMNVPKSCSMALGDTGISLLNHTAGYAVFANGGREAIPYGILQIKTPEGKILFKQTKVTPRQLFDYKHISYLNSMLGRVVHDGTGQRAKLEFTTAAGKTGTSSFHRDAWFMGFTGKYVAGVWYGNDNYRPMRRATGGSFPAEAWKKFMNIAHTDLNIAQLPGLRIHPNQVRLARRKPERLDPPAVDVQPVIIREPRPRVRRRPKPQNPLQNLFNSLFGN